MYVQPEEKLGRQDLPSKILMGLCLEARGALVSDKAPSKKKKKIFLGPGNGGNAPALAHNHIKNLLAGLSIPSHFEDPSLSIHIKRILLHYLHVLPVVLWKTSVYWGSIPAITHGDSGNVRRRR